MSTVTIARTGSGEVPFLPTAVQLADGRILVAYRAGRAHTHCVGRILAVESADDGTTWSEPRTVVDTPLDDRDPMLTRLSSGDILLSYFRIDWDARPWEVPGVDVIRSTDGGTTWSEPVPVASTMQQPTDERWHGYRSGHIATHGQLLELPDGDLLAPIYGVFPGDTHHSAALVRSTDGGLTWPAGNEVVLGRRYVEPVLALLPGGQVTALLRTDEGSPGTGTPRTAASGLRAELTRSDDNGHTWSEPQQLDLYASSAVTLPLSDGSLLLAYGDMSGRINPGRPTVATVVPNPLGPWDKSPRHLVHDAGGDTYDQANPTAVELPDGRLLIISYDIFRREIAGVFRDRASLA